MSSKFGALAAQVSKPFRVDLINPATGEKIVDEKGNPAWIDVLSTDSAEGRAIDAEQRRQATDALIRRGEDTTDQNDRTVSKIARLTKAWHLVDPVTGDVVAVDCTPDNALELYSEPGTAWIYLAVWSGATSVANFIGKPAKG